MSIFSPLPDRKYSVIYADPPWNYKGQKQHNGCDNEDTGGAENHYKTLSLNDLKTLDVPSICEDDALLFMWITSPHLDQGITLGQSWGFKWATVAFVWDKMRVNPGFYTMSQCELCVVMKRGRIPTPRGSRNIRQLVVSPRTEHSQKPDEVPDRIDLMFPSLKKIELFARPKVLSWNWDSWGDEVASCR